MNQYTQSELEKLAKYFYRRETGRCIRCSAPVEYKDVPSFGRRTKDVIVQCPRCGASGQYSPAYLEAMNLTWTDQEKQDIVNQYWQRAVVRCPRDKAILEILEVGVVGSIYVTLSVNCQYCSRNFQSQEIEMVAPIVDPNSFESKYEVVQPIARGGMGTVSLARKKDGGGLFAAKQILPQFLKQEIIVRRFQREARILTQLSHDGVVPMHEFFIDESGGIIVMDYMEKGDLRSAINDSSISSQQLADAFSNVAKGLDYLHSTEIIHRDLKPGNILLDNSYLGKISDLGLAMMINRDSTTLTKTNQALGTYSYMAPEQRDAKSVTYKADIYSMGLICYEIVTRVSPYHVVRLQDTHHVFSNIENAISTNPADRTITTTELALSLQDFFSQSQV